MNEVVWRRIRAAIQSIEGAADVEIHAGGEAVCLSRRHSPYASHREVEWLDDAVDIPNCVVFLTTRFCLFIRPITAEVGPFNVPAKLIDSEYEYESTIRWGGIPRRLVQDILDVAARYVPMRMLSEQTLVRAGVVMPVVERWDGEKPVYRRRQQTALPVPEPEMLDGQYVYKAVGSRQADLIISMSGEVRTGCFYGTIAEFIAAVQRQHGDNEYAQQYRAVLMDYGRRVALAKAAAEAKDFVIEPGAVD